MAGTQEMLHVKTKDEKAQTWAGVAKAIRTAVRLKHSLRAEEEINARLGPMQDRFSELYDAGLPIEFDSDRLTLKKKRVKKNVAEISPGLWVAK